MTEPDPVAAAVKEVNAITTAIVTTATRQVSAVPGSAEHAELTARLAEQVRLALTIENVSAEAAMMGLARSAGAVVQAICDALSVDAPAFMESVEANVLHIDTDSAG